MVIYKFDIGDSKFQQSFVMIFYVDLPLNLDLK